MDLTTVVCDGYDKMDPYDFGPLKPCMHCIEGMLTSSWMEQPMHDPQEKGL